MEERLIGKLYLNRYRYRTYESQKERHAHGRSRCKNPEEAPPVAWVVVKKHGKYKRHELIVSHAAGRTKVMGEGIYLNEWAQRFSITLPTHLIGRVVHRNDNGSTDRASCAPIGASQAKAAKGGILFHAVAIRYGGPGSLFSIVSVQRDRSPRAIKFA